MLKTDLKEILQNGENSGIEFKRDDIQPKKLAQEIVAFANEQGVYISFGAEDNGSFFRDITRTNVPENQKMSLKSDVKTEKVPDYVPVNEFQGQLLSLIKDNPSITYNELSLKTERDRKTVGRHLKILKEKGFLYREGPAKGGHWKVFKP